MASSREYPERPIVGIGGVIIDRGRTLLIRRGSEPLLGEWSIPGGTLELGESLKEGVARELREETGIEVRVLELIEVFDRVYLGDGSTEVETKPRPRFHFVIADYLCERVGGEPKAGRDVTDVPSATEEYLSLFHLSARSRHPLAGRVAVTEIAPFGLSTVIRPPIDSRVTPANDVFTPASPFTFLAVTDPLVFSTVRFPLIRSVKTLPKLVLAKVSPPMSVSEMPPFPVTARIPFGTFEASMAPKEDFNVMLPRASRTEILPLDVSASRAPLMVSNSMLPKESRMVTEPPFSDLPFTRPLLSLQFPHP